MKLAFKQIFIRLLRDQVIISGRKIVHEEKIYYYQTNSFWVRSEFKITFFNYCFSLLF